MLNFRPNEMKKEESNGFAVEEFLFGIHACGSGGIAPRSVELCEASAAVNDIKRPSRFGQQRGCLFPFGSEQQARLVRPEVA